MLENSCYYNSGDFHVSASAERLRGPLHTGRIEQHHTFRICLIGKLKLHMQELLFDIWLAPC